MSLAKRPSRIPDTDEKSLVQPSAPQVVLLAIAVDTWGPHACEEGATPLASESQQYAERGRGRNRNEALPFDLRAALPLSTLLLAGLNDWRRSDSDHRSNSFYESNLTRANSLSPASGTVCLKMSYHGSYADCAVPCPSSSISSAFIDPHLDQRLTREASTQSDNPDPFLSVSYSNNLSQPHAHEKYGFGHVDSRSSNDYLSNDVRPSQDRIYMPPLWEQQTHGEFHVLDNIDSLETTSLNAHDDGTMRGCTYTLAQPSLLVAGNFADLRSTWDVHFPNNFSQHSGETSFSARGGIGAYEGYPEPSDEGRTLFDATELDSLWTGPTYCHLEGCRHNHEFQTLQTWKSHIKNVHVKDIYCWEPGCPHKRPFANNTDLKRHYEAKHDPIKTFRCHRPDCTRRVKSWSRKDKLQHHNATWHSNFKCFFCSATSPQQAWFDTEAELWDHTISDHPQP